MPTRSSVASRLFDPLNLTKIDEENVFVGKETGNASCTTNHAWEAGPVERDWRSSIPLFSFLYPGYSLGVKSRS